MSKSREESSVKEAPYRFAPTIMFLLYHTKEFDEKYFITIADPAVELIY